MRQIASRIAAMPVDAPLIQMLEARAAEQRAQVEYDEALAPFKGR